MKWSKEEVRLAVDAADEHDRNGVLDLLTPAIVHAIMARAVELAAARGGTMTAEDWAEEEERWIGTPFFYACNRMRKDATALGARNAVLEAERNNARAVANRLEAAVEEQFQEKARLQKRCTALETELAEARATIARLTAAAQALSEHADRTAGGCDCALKNITCIHWASNTRTP